MMLLDTQSAVWLLQAPEELGSKARQTIRIAAGQLCFSAISCWELGMLTSKGRMTLASPLRRWVDAVIESGITIVDVSREVATDAGTLPGDIHGDSGDRIVIATARALGCALITSDRKILAYAAAGHLRAIDARR